MPFALEATGAIGPTASKLIKKLAPFRRLIPFMTPAVVAAKFQFRRRIATILARERSALVGLFQQHARISITLPDSLSRDT